MAYIPINNTQVDPDSPVTAELMTALRDNPIAMFAGDAGAPRLQWGALPTLNAGNNIRWQRSSVGTGSATLLDFLQSGTIRFAIEANNTTESSTRQVILTRERGDGGGSTVFTWSVGASLGWQSRTDDISILAGDRLSMTVTAGGGIEYRNIRVMTGSASLFPAGYTASGRYVF